MIENKIIIPKLNFNVGDKVQRNGEIAYISDVIFSIADFKWLVVAIIIDDNEIIQKTVTIPLDLW